jgi:hypothetical protein
MESALAGDVCLKDDSGENQNVAQRDCDGEPLGTVDHQPSDSRALRAGPAWGSSAFGLLLREADRVLGCSGGQWPVEVVQATSAEREARKAEQHERSEDELRDHVV